MYLREIHAHRFKEINHYYLISGHSYNACDRAFGNVEKSVRTMGNIYDFKGYCMAIKCATTAEPKVTVMKQDHFYDLKLLQGSITHRTPPKPLSFMDARRFCLKSQYRWGYFLSMNLDDPLTAVALQKGRATTKNPLAFNLANVSLYVKYSEARELKPDKIAHLKKLLPFIPERDARYLRYIIDTQDDLAGGSAGGEEEEEEEGHDDDLLDYDDGEVGP